jgi:hypothetical protein
MIRKDFIANLINFYYPLSPFVATVFADYLISKKFSERDYDKLFKWLTNNFSRKWKITPTNTEIEEAEKAIKEFADKIGNRKDALDYGRKPFALITEQEPDMKDFSKEIDDAFEKLKKKLGMKKQKREETHE